MQQSLRPRRLPVWHGSQRDAADLLKSAEHNCTCIRDDHNVPVQMCPAHTMIFADQRALDGLLFARHMRRRLKAEEFRTTRASVA